MRDSSKPSPEVLNRLPERTFGALLKIARRRAGMTQKQLADLSTVSVRALRDLELDLTCTPRRETVRLLAEALQVSVASRQDLEEAARGPGLWAGYGDDPTPPPAPLRPIIGRARDVATLMQLVESDGPRLICVVGMPGVGKTRLIQEMASAIHQGSTIPVTRVDSWEPTDFLHDRSLSGRIASFLAGEPQLDPLAAALANRKILLTMDEKAESPQVEERLRLLLQRCPELRVVYESPTPPRDPDAAHFPVFPLTVVDPENSNGTEPMSQAAVQFLLSRSPNLRGDAASSLHTMNTIASICWYLDGIPQALETAATWLLVFDPVQLLNVAKRHPLRLLTPPQPHPGKDLRASLIHTVKDLNTSTRGLLHQLSGIPGAWTLDQATIAAGVATSVALSDVHQLCMHSIVRPASPTADGQPRFSVLNLFKHLVRERTPSHPWLDHYLTPLPPSTSQSSGGSAQSTLQR
ncbi:AAA family ATPase [Streptomyces decoyicus]|uniref:AAA family ATPase n=1 Tax=Streptomyces decoyicus TaxID=249567 RepID=UPI0033AF3539